MDVTTLTVFAVDLVLTTENYGFRLPHSNARYVTSTMRPKLQHLEKYEERYPEMLSEKRGEREVATFSPGEIVRAFVARRQRENEEGKTQQMYAQS